MTAHPSADDRKLTAPPPRREMGRPTPVATGSRNCRNSPRGTSVDNRSTRYGSACIASPTAGPADTRGRSQSGLSPGVGAAGSTIHQLVVGAPILGGRSRRIRQSRPTNRLATERTASETGSGPVNSPEAGLRRQRCTRRRCRSVRRPETDGLWHARTGPPPAAPGRAG